MVKVFSSVRLVHYEGDSLREYPTQSYLKHYKEHRSLSVLKKG